jgi:hypothetical protein
MSETKVSRRGHGEDAIYFTAAKNRYVGSVSLGYGPDGKRIRCEVFGKTKQEVRARLKALHQELKRGSAVIPRTRQDCSIAVNTAILHPLAWQDPAGGYRNAVDAAIMPG